MSSSSYINQVVAGDDVYGSDGDKLGTVADVQPHYLVVEKGWFFPTDYYIPMDAVASTGDGAVYLNVPKDTALHSGWDSVPEAVSLGTAGTVSTDIDMRSSDREMAGYEVAAEDELRIPVMEEELTATVRQQEAGAVRIEKRVVEEDRVLEVPVTDEQIRVERRIVDRPVGAADAQAFEEIVVEVPLTREDVELQKEARVSEEIVVGKEAVQRTEQVRGTVRREEVIVDEQAIAGAEVLDTYEGEVQSR